MQMFYWIVKYYTMCVSQKDRPLSLAKRQISLWRRLVNLFRSKSRATIFVCLDFVRYRLGAKKKKSSETTVKFTRTEIRCWVLKKNNCYLGNFLSGHSWSEYCVSKRVPLFTGHPAALISKHLPQLSLSPDIMTSHSPRSSQQPFSAAASPVAPEPHATGRHVFTVVGVYQACCVPSNPTSWKWNRSSHLCLNIENTTIK